MPFAPFTSIIRTAAAEVKQTQRQTMGVRLMNLAPGDSVVAVARNAEAGPGTVPDADEDGNGNGALAEAVDPAGDASANGSAPPER